MMRATSKILAVMGLMVFALLSQSVSAGCAYPDGQCSAEEAAPATEAAAPAAEEAAPAAEEAAPAAEEAAAE